MCTFVIQCALSLSPSDTHTHSHTHTLFFQLADGVSGRLRKHLWIWGRYRVRHTNALYVRLTLRLVSSSTALSTLWCSFTGSNFDFLFFFGRKPESEIEQLVILVFAGKCEGEGLDRGKHTDSKYFVDYHWLRWRAESPRWIISSNFNDVLGVFPPVKHLHRQIQVSFHVSEAVSVHFALSLNIFSKM